ERPCPCCMKYPPPPGFAPSVTMSSSPMTGCMSLDVTGFFSDSRTVPLGTKNGGRDLPVTVSRFALLRFGGGPLNMGFGSFSFSSSLVGSGCAASGARAKRVSSEAVRMRLVIQILGKRPMTQSYNIHLGDDARQRATGRAPIDDIRGTLVRSLNPLIAALALFGGLTPWAVPAAGSNRGLASASPTTPFTRLYVFGDSYSAPGSVYADGNGPTAVAYLGWLMGLQIASSSALHAPQRSLVFAVSGAGT